MGVGEKPIPEMIMAKSPVSPFSTEVRNKFVKPLADLLYFANAQREGNWAGQSKVREQNGVYGNAQDTLTAIIRETCGDAIANEWTEHLELGAGYSFLAGVEDAIDATREHLAEEASRRAEREAEEAEEVVVTTIRLNPPVKFGN